MAFFHLTPLLFALLLLQPSLAVKQDSKRLRRQAITGAGPQNVMAADMREMEHLFDEDNALLYRLLQDNSIPNPGDGTGNNGDDKGDKGDKGGGDDKGDKGGGDDKGDKGGTGNNGDDKGDKGGTGNNGDDKGDKGGGDDKGDKGGDLDERDDPVVRAPNSTPTSITGNSPSPLPGIDIGIPPAASPAPTTNTEINAFALTAPPMFSPFVILPPMNNSVPPTPAPVPATPTPITPLFTIDCSTDNAGLWGNHAEVVKTVQYAYQLELKTTDKTNVNEIIFMLESSFNNEIISGLFPGDCSPVPSGRRAEESDIQGISTSPIDLQLKGVSCIHPTDNCIVVMGALTVYFIDGDDKSEVEGSIYTILKTAIDDGAFDDADDEIESITSRDLSSLPVTEAPAPAPTPEQQVDSATGGAPTNDEEDPVLQAQGDNKLMYGLVGGFAGCILVGVVGYAANKQRDLDDGDFSGMIYEV